MDTDEITAILKRDRFTRQVFRGVFARDRLPMRRLPHPSAIVVNTDPSTKPGQHWVAIYFTRDGVGEYFDSYGQPPSLSPIKTFLQKNTRQTVRNRTSLQGPLSAVCGQYSLFYLLHRCRDIDMSTITGFFSTNKRENDIIVNEFIKRHFPGINTKVYDFSFANRQISKSLL